MRRKTVSLEDDLLTYRCWHCRGERSRCPKCHSTGQLFYVNGYTFPYTPHGEKQAKALSFKCAEN